LIIPRANAGIHGVGYAEKGMSPMQRPGTAPDVAFHIMELLFQHA